jgi:hypothetical protein
MIGPPWVVTAWRSPDPDGCESKKKPNDSQGENDRAKPIDF